MVAGESPKYSRTNPTAALEVGIVLGEEYDNNHPRGCQTVSAPVPEVLVQSVRERCPLDRHAGKGPWQNPLFARDLDLELSNDLERER